MVISFFSPPSLSSVSRGVTSHPPDIDGDSDSIYMDYDDDDFGAETAKITSPGESITSARAFMRGHGTYVDSDEVIASVAGVIERVNKLITVRALRTRYVERGPQLDYPRPLPDTVQKSGIW